LIGLYEIKKEFKNLTLYVDEFVMSI